MKNVNDFEEEIQRINSLYRHAKKTFIELIKAIDNGDKDKSNSLNTKLSELLEGTVELSGFNTENYLIGKYQYVIDVINNFFTAANIVQKAEDMDFYEVSKYTFDRQWGFVFHRYMVKKFDGPAVFLDEIDRWDEVIKEREKTLDVNNMIKELVKITTKTLTKTDELPDYYDMYQVTDPINIGDYIDCESIGKIIETCSNISRENIDLINSFFVPHSIGKDFHISIDDYPLTIKITCSDGRKIEIIRQFDKEEEPYFDDSGTYTIYKTFIYLYFPINQRKNMQCDVKSNSEDGYDTDYARILNKINNVKSPSGKTLDWKYFVLHKDNYITNEELEFISKELYSFVKGISSKSPKVRINALKKVLKNM